jgi:hypothetical protein
MWMTCHMYQKYVWIFIDNVDDFYSQIWCMFVNSHIWCTSFVDSHIWCVCYLWILIYDVYVVCGFSCGWYCLCGDKYSVCHKYMNFCVVTRGGKYIRRHIWALVGLTSIGTYYSWWKSCALTSVGYGMYQRKLAGYLPRASQWDDGSYGRGGGFRAALTSVSRNGPKLANFRRLAPHGS